MDFSIYFARWQKIPIHVIFAFLSLKVTRSLTLDCISAVLTALVNISLPLA